MKCNKNKHSFFANFRPHGLYRAKRKRCTIVFFLLDKGHEAENLQKECLFLLYKIIDKIDYNYTSLDRYILQVTMKTILMDAAILSTLAYFLYI